MSQDPGNMISLSLSPVILTRGRSYNSLQSISLRFKGRRYLLVNMRRFAEMPRFEVSKAKGRSYTRRALLHRIPEVHL